MSTPITGWPRIFTLGVLGFAVGLVIGDNAIHANLGFRTQTIYYPAAYELPKMPGGTSLRMAMLHDVLLERYLHHGAAWYEKRAAQSRAAIAADPAATGTPSMQTLDAMDDLAVALENLHHSDEAAAVMRHKLALLPAITLPPPPVITDGDDNPEAIAQAVDQAALAQSLTPAMHQQYTTRANLGTFLIHANFPKLLAGDADARARMQEGLEFIRQSIAINPGAHFGRETWQAVIVQHFLATQAHPELLTNFDVIGNSLTDITPLPIRHLVDDNLHFPAPVLDAQVSPERRLDLRRTIPDVGVAPAWAQVVHPDVAGSVHFDEPALALMGMWMLGGGPNPHSALALADIAFQVGQNEIAWDGYQRALDLQEAFSPVPSVRQSLVTFCLNQQKDIALRESPDAPTAWTQAQHQRHDAELAWGRHYQDDYQAWEVSQIAAGTDLDDPLFYTAFFKDRPSIASPVGHADDAAIRLLAPDGILDAIPVGLLAAGCTMLLAALTTTPFRKTPA